MIRHRLYLQIYAGFLAVALLCVLSAGFTGWMMRPEEGWKPPAGWQPPPDWEAKHRRFPWILGGLLGIAAIGSYPVARRITRRIESLRRGVEELGAGDLSSRVPVCGRDEVAELARAFNRSADQIQVLVHSQRRMLASASHELRSPLARVRVALELLPTLPPAEQAPLLREAAQDIQELDSLIADLLLAGRLGAPEPLSKQPVDLLALGAEEAARTGAELSGTPVEVRGDPKLLRRLIRNLLENANRHGAPPVELHIGPGPRLEVRDRGPGVPDSERERIFEAFYRPAGHREGEGGVGLGLALVRQITDAHGGQVHCLPREGGGSVFQVILG